MNRLFAFLICLMRASQVAAESPIIVTDIAPVHSLVSVIMGDSGKPVLLLPADVDPHHYAFRPSDAALIAQADLIIGVGAGLTPWLSDALGNLAEQTPQVMLAENGEWHSLPLRHEDHDHAAEGRDPHGWLDPKVAIQWAGQIAAALETVDPEDAGRYRANLVKLEQALTALDTELLARLAPVQDQPLLWPHDGYQYFEAHYGLRSVGSIVAVDGMAPGPAHIADLREMASTGALTCILTDTSISPALAKLVGENAEIKVVEIDNLGRDLEAGPMLYAAMLMRLTDQISACTGS